MQKNKYQNYQYGLSSPGRAPQVQKPAIILQVQGVILDKQLSQMLWLVQEQELFRSCLTTRYAE